MASFKHKIRKKSKEKTTNKKKNVVKMQKSKFTESPLEELNNAVRQHFGLTEDKKMPTSGRKTGLKEEKPDKDSYDPPEMELDNEEEGKSIGNIPESAESFGQYCWRRLDEEFKQEENKEYYNNIANNLRKWLSSNSSLEEIRNDLKKISNGLEIWIEEELLNGFPSHELNKPKLMTKKADKSDIVFNADVSYEINLGLLGQYGSDLTKENPFMLGKYPYTPEKVCELINHRREDLELMAGFLKGKYTNFIDNTDINKTRKDFRTSMQTEFLDYCKAHTSNKRETNKREKTWASRLIKNKLIKLPFYDEPVSLNIFFSDYEKKIEVTKVLKKMIELRNKKEKKPLLIAQDQLVIVKLLCETEMKAKNIRETYWPVLRKVYPQELWIEYGILGRKGAPSKKELISDGDLTRLINNIKKTLRIQGKCFTEKDISTARNKVKPATKKPAKKRKRDTQ